MVDFSLNCCKLGAKGTFGILTEMGQYESKVRILQASFMVHCILISMACILIEPSCKYLSNK